MEPFNDSYSYQIASEDDNYTPPLDDDKLQMLMLHIISAQYSSL